MFKIAAKILTCILLAIILFEGTRMIINPYVRSEGMVRTALLKRTPMGTSMDEVIKYLEQNEKWTIKRISQTSGFRHRGIQPTETVGKKSITVYLNSYRSVAYFYLLETDVTVFYGFDEDSKLIDIWAWKTTDSL